MGPTTRNMSRQVKQETLENQVSNEMEVEEVVVALKATKFGQQQQPKVNGTTVKFQPVNGFETMMKSGVQQNISTRHQVRFLIRFCIS